MLKIQLDLDGQNQTEQKNSFSYGFRCFVARIIGKSNGQVPVDEPVGLLDKDYCSHCGPGIKPNCFKDIAKNSQL